METYYVVQLVFSDSSFNETVPFATLTQAKQYAKAHKGYDGLIYNFIIVIKTTSEETAIINVDRGAGTMAASYSCK
jgi:hypothetical protein